MEIESTKFGTITIDGKTYEHDVVIRLSGEVMKRKKKLSKKYYGTSHVLSKDEAKLSSRGGASSSLSAGAPQTVATGHRWPRSTLARVLIYGGPKPTTQPRRRR